MFDGLVLSEGDWLNEKPRLVAEAFAFDLYIKCSRLGEMIWQVDVIDLEVDRGNRGLTSVLSLIPAVSRGKRPWVEIRETWEQCGFFAQVSGIRYRVSGVGMSVGFGDDGGDGLG